MIVRGITPDGEAVFLELEIHGLSRRLVLHVQSEGRGGGRWVAVGLSASEARALCAVMAQQVAELERWERSATSAQDARVALSGGSPAPGRPVLPALSYDRHWIAGVMRGHEDRAPKLGDVHCLHCGAWVRWGEDDEPVGHEPDCDALRSWRKTRNPGG